MCFAANYITMLNHLKISVEFKMISGIVKSVEVVNATNRWQ